MSANDTQIGGKHYVTQQIQCWDYVHRNGIGFLAGCVIKYVSRYKTKNGVEDLKKARHFLDKLIEEEERDLLPRMSEAGTAAGLQSSGASR